MTRERYKELMTDDSKELTPDEIAEGWHFCREWDGLLVHPKMPEADCCTCEIERLRGALAAIAHEWQTQAEACADNSGVAYRMAEIAREALSPNK